ncbi:MAG TPA: phosphate regulon transcriptional regulator PhoB [Rhodocyclaceae bacterium]|nr:phosphate regulon transcriptional regulator PhoB [Rhodocyclaceae bacterium]
MPSDILIVEDEPITQKMIAVNLERSGHQVRSVASVFAAESAIRDQVPDLVLVDWMLPDVTGIALIRKLRADAETRDIPIIMLTSRAQESDMVTGLEAGADDYITKPFSPRELLARIKAVMRRRMPQLTDDMVEVAGLRIDPAAKRITVGGQELDLGSIEFRMLHFFATHPNRLFSRAQLLDEIWGNQVFVEERTVDVHIRRLRQALNPWGLDRLIETVRGTGYSFRREMAEKQLATG